MIRVMGFFYSKEEQSREQARLNRTLTKWESKVCAFRLVEPQCFNPHYHPYLPITRPIWTIQLLHLCQHVSQEQKLRPSIKKLYASSLSSQKSACSSFRATTTLETAQLEGSYNTIYLKELALHVLADLESP